jgi:hypothetical protein
MMKKIFPSLLLLLSCSIFFAFCAETDQSIDSLFPTTSQYDSEIDTLLQEVKEQVSYAEGFLRGDFTNVDFGKLNVDILKGKFEGEIGKKVRKLCFLGIKRNNEWLVSAAESFNLTLDEGKNFKEAWQIASINSDRIKKITETILVLSQGIVRIQVAKFLKKLLNFIPESYDLSGVDYIERLKLMDEAHNLESYKKFLVDWTQNVMKLWESQLGSRPAIISHGKFFLKQIEFSGKILQMSPLLNDPAIAEAAMLRDSIIKDFFEGPIFGIEKENLNHW